MLTTIIPLVENQAYGAYILSSQKLLSEMLTHYGISPTTWSHMFAKHFLVKVFFKGFSYLDPNPNLPQLQVTNLKSWFASENNTDTNARIMT